MFYELLHMEMQVLADQQRLTSAGYSLEDLPKAMDDRVRWQES